MVTVNGRIQVRRGTASEFAAADPVLAFGELAVASTEQGGTVVRIGDGSRPWSALTGLDPEVLAQALTALAGRVAAVEDGEVELTGAVTTLAGRVTDAEGSLALKAPFVPALEMVPATAYGNSYGNNAGGSSADATTASPFRVVSRLRMIPLADRTVSATRTDQIATRVAATWTAPGRGVVFLPEVLLNDAIQNRDTATAVEAFRSILTYLSAVDIAPRSAASIQYGPGWIDGTSSTVGAHVDMAFAGDALAVLHAAGSTGGTYTVTDEEGNLRATVNTGGFGAPFPGVAALDGFGPGDHTVRVEVTAGSVTLNGSAVESTNAPLIVWCVPGPLAGEVGAEQNAKIAAFVAALEPIAAAFPNVVTVKTDSRWDPAAMTASDGLHLQDRGNSYVADLVVEALLNVDFRQGINRLITVPPYVAPSPSYATPDSTVPSQVTGVEVRSARQASVKWSPVASDGDATLRRYDVLASTGGEEERVVGTAGPSATALTIESGLTPGATYAFRVVAVNVVGSSAPSAAVSATAGPVLVVYASDTLLGDGSTDLGVTQVGSYPWTGFPSSTSVWRRTATGAAVLTSHTDRNYRTADDGQPAGRWEITMGTTGGTPGLAFCIAPDFATLGYMFWHTGTAWVVTKQAAATSARQTILSVPGSFTAPAAVWAERTAAGVITVGVGDSTIGTVTDTSYSGTRHGIYSYAGTAARFTSYRHIA